VQQRGGVDEFDEGRGVDVARSAITAGARREQHDQRPQPLAAARDNVLGNLIDECDGAFHAGPDHRIDGAEVGMNQSFDSGQGSHGRGW